jgi:tetratricopeptide (TPR) repeat protein
MFEFGYLAARLQPSYLHLFLIGIKRADLPSDLLGIRAEEVELHSVSEMAADIVDRFRGQLHYPQIEPLEIFRHWSRWKHWIESQVNNEEAPDHRLGEVLLHSIQPAFYMGELPQLQSYCKKVHDSHTSEVTAAKRIIAPIVRYNSIADSEDPARISAADLKPITDALSMPPELDPAENPSMYWFETVRTDYLALCYYQLAGISGRQKAPGRSAIAEQKHYLEKAETAISQADGFLRSTPQSRAQHDAVYCLWQGYILRNWGRIRTAAGDLEKAAQLYSEAVEARKHAYAGFLAEDIDHAMLDQIEVEILLADLDMVQLNPGSSSLILGQAVDTLLEKQKKWIGLWTRAFVQAEQLAVMHGLEDIAQKLREKLHHGAH